MLANAISPTSDTATNIKLVPLTDGRLTGNAWYLIADPLQHSGLDLLILAGSEGKPRLERIPASAVPSNQPDGTYYRIGYSAVCVPSDYRALYQDPGA